MGKKNLYTIVTNDKYELPIKCDLKAREAAEFLRTDENNIRRSLIRPWKKSKYKVVISGSIHYDRKGYEKVHGSEIGVASDEEYFGYYEKFTESWENAVYRLRNSGADLEKISIVCKQGKNGKGNLKRSCQKHQ